MARNGRYPDLSNVTGRDMPGVDAGDYDLNERPTETGYGASIEDVQRGYCTEPVNDSDSRTGDMPMPMPEEPQGFLWRGIPIDR